MSKKRFSAEQIVTLLRQIEVVMGHTLRCVSGVLHEDERGDDEAHGDGDDQARKHREHQHHNHYSCV